MAKSKKSDAGVPAELPLPYHESPAGLPSTEGLDGDAIDQTALASKTLAGLDEIERQYTRLLTEGTDEVLTISERMSVIQKLTGVAKIRADILISSMATQQRKSTIGGPHVGQPGSAPVVAFPPGSPIIPSVFMPAPASLEEP